jgi:hypothetical protein
MAYEIVFKTTTRSDIDAQMVVRATTNNEIFIEITDEERNMSVSCIFLDRETAIKFTKELRKQISFLED